MGAIPLINRLKSVKPTRCRAGAAGNTEGKTTNSGPRNDSGVRSLDGAKVLHKTPALTLAMSFHYYISGFADGEACFCVSFQPSRRHRFGWEVRPSFSISQNADRADLLYRLKDLWMCGTIRPDRSDRTVKYEVRKLSDLLRVVLPHFRKCPLLSAKRRDVACLSPDGTGKASRERGIRGDRDGGDGDESIGQAEVFRKRDPQLASVR